MALNFSTKFLLGFGLYLTIWSHIPGYELVVQLSSVLVIALAALLCLLKGGKMNFLSPLEILLIPILLLSLATSLATGNMYSFQYSIVFAVFCVSVGLIVRQLSIREILDIFTYAVAAIVITLMLTQYEELVVGLSITISKYTGLLRFEPLGMHPNLTGMVYGGAVVCLGFKTLYEKTLTYKAIFAVLTCCCLAFIIAASARAALVALVCVFVFSLIKYLLHLDSKKATYIAIGSALSGLFLVLYFDQVFTYLTEILEFNSDTRGIGSGGTGRVQLWQLGVDTIMNDIPRLLFGHGLRSSESYMIGFSLESSYLTLVYEMGVFFTLAMLVIFAWSIRISNRKSEQMQEHGVGPYFAATMIIVYLIFQSFFNRYLISIGNVFSILFLLVLFRVFLEKQIKIKI